MSDDLTKRLAALEIALAMREPHHRARDLEAMDERLREYGAIIYALQRVYKDLADDVRELKKEQKP